MSAVEQAAMDRRMKLELWKAQKEAEKAAKGQVRSSRARPCAALSAAGLVRPLHPARGVVCSARMLLAAGHFAARICPTRGRTAAVPRGPRAG